MLCLTGCQLGDNRIHGEYASGSSVWVVSFSINQGAEWTNTRGVQLDLSAPSASHVAVANSESACLDSAEWSPYVSALSHNLTDSLGEQTVFVKFKNEQGNESPCYAQQISLDDLEPLAPLDVQFSSVGGASLTETPNIDFSPRDDRGPGGISHIEARVVAYPSDTELVGWTQISSGDSLSGLAGLTSENSAYRIEVRAVDQAGNPSKVISSDTISETLVEGQDSFFVESVRGLKSADLDGDGDDDFLYVTEQRLYWAENTDGAGTFAEGRLVVNEQISTLPLYEPDGGYHLVDVDGSGSLDVVFTEDDSVIWVSNDLAASGDWLAAKVLLNAHDRVLRSAVGDFNGDGQKDVAAVSLTHLEVALKLADGSYSSQLIAHSVVDEWRFYKLMVGDIDGDGHEDILLDASGASRIYWNSSGLGSFSDANAISPPGNYRYTLGDFDSDGDLDLAAYSGVYRNDSGTFNVVLADYAGESGGRSEMVDVDQDGDLDLMVWRTAFEETVSFFENTDGVGAFAPSVDVHTLFWTHDMTDFATLDLDADGDRDLVIASTDPFNFVSYTNSDGAGTYTNETPVGVFYRSATITANDFDGDGDVDLVLSTDSGLYFKSNLNNSGRFAQAVLVGGIDDTIYHLADLDGDGDLDFITSDLGSGIYWHENLGSLSVGPRQTITTNVSQLRSVRSGDLDGDGDLDLVSSQQSGNKMAKYMNLGGGSFSGQQVISTSVNIPTVSALFDADNDGDLDVVFVGFDANGVRYYDNSDGNGTLTGPVSMLATLDSCGVRFVDMDNDGDSDLICGTHNDFKWHRNTDGMGSCSSPAARGGRLTTAKGPKTYDQGSSDPESLH